MSDGNAHTPPPRQTTWQGLRLLGPAARDEQLVERGDDDCSIGSVGDHGVGAVSTVGDLVHQSPATAGLFF